MVHNKKLADERGISIESRKRIDELHEICDKAITQMEMFDFETPAYQVALLLWRLSQEELQKLWGFDKDKSRWCEWRLPKCTCPKMDNEDAGRYIYFSMDCPLHNIR